MIISLECDDKIIVDASEKEEERVNDKSSFKSSKETIDINKNLEINSDVIVDVEKEKISNKTKLNSTMNDAEKGFEYEKSIISLSTIENDPSDFRPKNLSRDSFELILDEIIIDKLIQYIIKKHDEGVTFDQIQYFIEQQILRLGQTMDNSL